MRSHGACIGGKHGGLRSANDCIRLQSCSRRAEKDCFSKIAVFRGVPTIVFGTNVFDYGVIKIVIVSNRACVQVQKSILREKRSFTELRLLYFRQIWTFTEQLRLYFLQLWSSEFLQRPSWPIFGLLRSYYACNFKKAPVLRSVNACILAIFGLFKSAADHLRPKTGLRDFYKNPPSEQIRLLNLRKFHFNLNLVITKRAATSTEAIRVSAIQKSQERPRSGVLRG